MIDAKLFKAKLKKISLVELGELEATSYRELNKANSRADQLINQTAYANARMEFEACAEYAHKLYLIEQEIEERNK